MMENRERIEGGISQLPRTRTSSVPGSTIRDGSYECHKDHDTISSFFKAVAWIAVTRENDDLVATILQAHCSINDQSFCATDTQIWMEEGNILLLLF